MRKTVNQANRLVFRSEIIAMTSSLSVTKQICDAEGCFAAAEEEIKVPVGQMGEISLAVCRKCKPRFIPK